jgi:hypothetical protein
MSQDMRTWIDQLEKAGLLARISKPVYPRTQMGALLWQARDRGLLFENLPGYPGWRCLGQAPGDVALAPVAFDKPRDEMIPEFVRRTETLGKTRLVETGPVQQIDLLGDDVDITKMPIHQAGIRDGGPFIGSGLMITKNPETGQRNLSFHRLQMKGPKKTGILLYPRHAWTNYQMYEAQDKPMPVAIMIGHHPMYIHRGDRRSMVDNSIASALLREDVSDKYGPSTGSTGRRVCRREIAKIREPEGPFSEFKILLNNGTNPRQHSDHHAQRCDLQERSNGTSELRLPKSSMLAQIFGVRATLG